MSDQMKEQAGPPRKTVNVTRPLQVLPKEEEWLLLAFVDKEHREDFETWWEGEGQRVFYSWKDKQR